MSKIVSPVPIEIRILYNELNGNVNMLPPSRPIPFPVLVSIFANLLTVFAGQFIHNFPEKPPVGPPVQPPAGGN